MDYDNIDEMVDIKVFFVLSAGFRIKLALYLIL